MLPLEAIGVLGVLFIFFMVGTVRALRAKSAVRRRLRARPQLGPLVSEVVPETVKPGSGRRSRHRP